MARGGKLSRSEVITVRLDPKLRLAAELAAAKERRTLSSFVERTIEEAIQRVTIPLSSSDHPLSVYAIVEQFWDVDEPDRFIKLALRFPELLTSDEQRLWKVIREEFQLYALSPATDPLALPQIDVIRQRWEELKRLALRSVLRAG